MAYSYSSGSYSQYGAGRYGSTSPYHSTSALYTGAGGQSNTDALYTGSHSHGSTGSHSHGSTGGLYTGSHTSLYTGSSSGSSLPRGGQARLYGSSPGAYSSRSSSACSLQDPSSRYTGTTRYSEPYDSTTARYGSRADRPSSYSGSTYGRSYTVAAIDTDKTGIDYRKLYEQEKQENEKLRKDVDKLSQQLTETQLDLERTKLKTETKTNDSREKRALERKISELEEEVKTIDNLKSDNLRLKEENGALIRVISKLSK